jgi:acetyltransferase
VAFSRARREWMADRPVREASALPALPALAAIAAGAPRALGTIAAAELLAQAGIATAPVRLARTADEAVEHARALGFPVAMKIESPEILHKTEVRGVKLASPPPRGVDRRRHRAEDDRRGSRIRARGQP